MSRFVAGDDFWAFDPDVDAPGSLLEAAALLEYWRDRGLRFTVRGLTLEVQEPRDLNGKLLSAADLQDFARCEPHLKSLLRLEAQAEYNLGLTTSEPSVLVDHPLPPGV